MMSIMTPRRRSRPSRPVAKLTRSRIHTARPSALSIGVVKGTRTPERDGPRAGFERPAAILRMEVLDPEISVLHPAFVGVAEYRFDIAAGEVHSQRRSVHFRDQRSSPFKSAS